MAFFATPYTIHFDDTMAYQSHHFLTGFKFQCAARETLLYGDLIFDRPGVPEVLDSVHLFTADAYCRNLRPAFLGERLVIFLSLEEWGAVSARFCYRVLNQQGQPICAGFQTHVCADPRNGQPMPLPSPLRDAFEDIRSIEEMRQLKTFRDCVLAGGDQTADLFSEELRELARHYLLDRYPAPRIVDVPHPSANDPRQETVQTDHSESSAQHQEESIPSIDACESIAASAKANDADGETVAAAEADGAAGEVWVFPGQGSFDAKLFCQVLSEFIHHEPDGKSQIDQCQSITAELIGGDCSGFFSGQLESCQQAAKANPDLCQIGIYLQGVLTAYSRKKDFQPAILMGHSIGEIAALTVAGSLSLTEGIRAVGERVRALRQWGPKDGRLIAVMADRSTVSEELALSGLPGLVVAGRNHDKQTIVSGPSDQILDFSQRMQRRGTATVDVPSPTSFHHPVLSPASKAWREALENLAFQTPTTTVYSPIGRRMVGGAENIPTVLSTQLLRPFDLQGAVEDLALAGFRTLVDCGSTGVLTRLLDRIAPESMQVINAGKINAGKINAGKINAVEALQWGRIRTDEEAADRSNQTTKSSPPGPSHPEEAASKPVEKKTTHEAGSAHERPAIAVVGQGCLLPGGASSPERFHSVLMQGRSGIVDLRDRDPYWEQDFFTAAPQPDKSTSGLAGVVQDGDIVAPAGVDPEFFESLSRAQKLLCIAIAPCTEFLNPNDRVLCLVGSTADGFQDQDRVAALKCAGIDPSSPRLADRLGDQAAAFQSPYSAVCHVFDQLIPLKKSIQLVDAACASSLYSVALGMSALERGEVDVVLAGGVYCPGPGNNCLFSQFGGLTATGCRPFDVGADGVVFSEGSAFVVLRRLDTAKKLRQSPLAIIRGFGLSSDGRSPSANVPQSSGQMIAMRRCYDDYNLDPSTITAIEGHGTSTPAGDSTEIKSLSEFFAPHASQPLPLHSLKGLLGHTGWAAGAASIIAATQMFQSRTFPAQANFSQPSKALANAEKVLFVPRQPVELPDRQCRIAIDGFGFGGANAHLVLESIDESEIQTRSVDSEPLSSTESPQDLDEQLVIVAKYQINSKQFHHLQSNYSSPDASEAEPPEATHQLVGDAELDRDSISLPPGIVLLPDLRDDMDFSQRLSLHLTGKIFSQIPKIDRQLSSQTSLILALEGKTERAVEATLRVLAPRFLREWSDLPEAETIRKAYQQLRPSGPYTLQCMMPNVAAGRVALHFNLNGPNFVVDAGENSLAAALSSASLLLRSGPGGGTKIAIVAQINLNCRLPVDGYSDADRPESACAFAITTRRTATELGLPDLGPPDTFINRFDPNFQSSISSDSGVTDGKVAAETDLSEKQLSGEARREQEQEAERVDQRSERQQPSRSLFELHTPEWVEMPLDFTQATRSRRTQDRCLVFVPSDRNLVEEVLLNLQERDSESWLVAVGPGAASLVTELNCSDAFAIETLDEFSAQNLVDLIDQIQPNLVLSVARPVSWNSMEAIRAVADNSLCECMFVAAKHLVDSIKAGETEIWGLFPQSWSGDVIHPLTGSLVGMLKSAQREIPSARMGVISHRSEQVAKVFKCLEYERSLEILDDVEVAYDSDRRMVRRLRRLPDAGAGLSDNSRKLELDENSVVVATGGARGVTAVMVESLLRDYGCTVITWGRSPVEPPLVNFQTPVPEQEFYQRFLAENPGTTPIAMRKQFQQCQAWWEVQQQIDQLLSLPGRVLYMQVDVDNPQALGQAISEVQSKFGRLDLIIHGAGVQFSKRLEERSLHEFRKTFSTKVGGLSNLVHASQKRFGRLVPVHALTSAYSIFGNDGQHDYGAANETLDRFCEWVSHSRDSVWSSLAWPAWNRVGMTRGSEYQALADQRKLALLEPAEGQDIFRRVIQGTSQASVNALLSQAEHTRYCVRTLPYNPLGSALRTLEMSVPLARLTYLEHHKAGGQPTLPGAWIIEQMVRAVLRLADRPVRQLAVENIRFRRFVRIQNHPDRRMRVIVESNRSGFSAWLVGDIISPAGIRLATDEVFASAFLSMDPKPFSDKHPVNGETSHSNPPTRSVQDPYCNDHQSVQLSGPFDCLRHIVIDSSGRHATFSPQINHAWYDVVPSLLLDACIRVAGMHAAQDGLHVPTEIQRVILPIGVSTQSLDNANWVIQATSPVVNGNNIRCGRVEVLDDRGQVQLIIEGAVVTKLHEKKDTSR